MGHAARARPLTTEIVIAHVLSSFGVGGQERVALDLARGQRERGHRVLAVSLAPPPDGPLAAEFMAAGVETVTVPKRDGFDALLPRRLAALFRRENVRIVHTHNPQPLVYGAPAARLARARAIHTKHGSNPDRGRRLWLRRAAGWLCDAVVAVSDTTAEIARENHEAPTKRLHVVPNGIDLSRFFPDAEARAAVRAELGIPSGAWVTGTVARLSPEKDQALLVRAAAPLLGENAWLLLAGDGPEAAALRELVSQLPNGKFVRLLGARSDVPRVLASLDVFALSSRTEGLPLVIPEAMAVGLPVVSTAVGGIPAVVEEGTTGLLVPAGDEQALRDRLARLAGDHVLAQNLGHQGRERAVSQFSAQRMVSDYMMLYSKILGRA